MKKYIIIFISLIIGLVGLIILYQQIGFKDIWSQLYKLRFWQFFIIFSTASLMLGVTTWRWKIILKDFTSIPLSWWTVFKARLSEQAVSYLTPMMYYGGEGVRAYVLNKDKNVPVSTGLTSVLIDRISEFLGAFVFLFLGAVLMVIEKSFIWGILLFIFAFILFLSLYLFLELIGFDRVLLFIVKIFHLDKIKYNSKSVGSTTLGERLIFVGREATVYFQKSRSKFYHTTVLSLLSLVIWFIQTKLLLDFFGFYLPWSKIFIIKIIITLSGFIPIPADLGAYEGGHVLAFNIFGLPAEVAIAFSLITRSIDLIWVSVGIFLITHLVINFLTKLYKLLSGDRYEESTN